MKLHGGNFGHGFFSAGFTKWAGKTWNMDTESPHKVIGNSLRQAIIGGTASRITGNKFSNGAFTAALQYIVNEAGSQLSEVQSKAQANRQARELNAQGGNWTTVRTEDGNWTIQPANMRALEVAFGSSATESIIEAKSENYCKLICPSLSVGATLLGGDMSGSANNAAINSAIEFSNYYGKGVGVLQHSPVEDVSSFAVGFGRLVPVIKLGTAASAALNNYQACMIDCQSRRGF